ncbi:response regulator transcription factor [Nocardioides sp. YIM 152588]|uniref:helix-turn-helix transcriptional regulator n=1 Tax=Nocardioides sp. YIM 152588 TaxID=3158259 RepID=UPI0032E42E32
MPDLSGPQPRSGESSAVGPAPPVVVVSDQALIAEAVAAALRNSGLEASYVPWGEVPDFAAGDGEGELAAVGIALIEGDHTDLINAVADLVERSGETRWIVLTAVPAGALWGAVLEAGAALVLPRSSSLEQVVAAARGVAEGRQLRLAGEAGLRGAWERVREEREELVKAFGSLTRSEREVLDQLYRGRTVPEIAEAREVSVVTVRHQVRSVLRKLGVSSQLSAVAKYDRLRDGGPGGATP